MFEENNLFDFAKSQALKEKGMLAAATYDGNRESWLRQARIIAEHLAMRNGETNSDEVQKVLPRPHNVHPNTTGSLFKGNKWVFLGYTPTSKITGHARPIGRWSLS